MTATDKLTVERVAKTIWQSLQDFAVKQGVVVSGFPDNAWTAYITIAEDVLRAIDSSKHTLQSVDLDSGIAITDTGVYAPKHTETCKLCGAAMGGLNSQSSCPVSSTGAHYPSKTPDAK